mmetsp:Transcript_58263/g.151389  ORF Transcript_58263/g.151389 Transcript_58263/m.151389 type:complete len:97 (-) Transcript_58263:621-911(-)
MPMDKSQALLFYSSKLEVLKVVTTALAFCMHIDQQRSQRSGFTAAAIACLSPVWNCLPPCIVVPVMAFQPTPHKCCCMFSGQDGPLVMMSNQRLIS